MGADNILARAIAVLETVEWAAETDREEGGLEDACPCCGEAKSTGHGRYCSLDAVLRDAGSVPVAPCAAEGR